MAELTNLETKLGEVLGLARAAQVATEKVQRLAESEDEQDLVKGLEQMRREAAETEERCLRVTSAFDGKKTAIEAEASDVKSKAADMMKTYLDADSDALDGFEFLTMAEAAEVGHWSVLKAMTERGRHSEVTELVEWALPIQERHFSAVMDASKTLAASEDPDEVSS
jgi:hypothetical protein